MPSPYQFSLSDGCPARAVRVEQWQELADAIASLGLATARPTLVLVGGASKISPPDYIRLQQIFTEMLAPLAQILGLTVVDGGTDAGIMQLMGQARDRHGASFPLVGVAAAGTVVLPDGSASNPDAAPLEPHHSHFILVPGSNWGDESPWLAQTATVLAGNAPSVTLAINGGEVTWQDVRCSVEARRTTLVLAGSGRTADKLAAGLRGETSDDRARPLIASGSIRAIDLRDDLKVLERTIHQLLATSPFSPRS